MNVSPAGSATVVALGFFTLVATASAWSGPTVARHVLTRDVIAREPVDEANKFSAEGDKVCYFVQFMGVAEPSEIKQVWLYQGKTELEVPLSLEEGPSWRTWSCKQIFPDQLGAWQVELRDAQDAVMDSATFTVEK
jgi:hypothetical protein